MSRDRPADQRRAQDALVYIEGGGINVRQAKTGAVVWLPLTPRLESTLAAAPRDGPTIIAGEHGKPVS